MRAAARRASFDKVHGEVLAGRTVRDLWLAYYRAKVAPHGIAEDDPSVRQVVEGPFYAGAAAMLELMTRVSPDDISEEQGVEMIQRLHEELYAYSRRGGS